MQHVRLVMLREIIGWCDGWLESLNCGACRGFLVLLKGMSMMDDGFCTSYFSDADSIIGPRVMMSGTLSKCVVYQRVQVPPPRSHHSFHHASDRKLHHPQLGLIPIYNNPSISLAVYSMVPSPPPGFQWVSVPDADGNRTLQLAHGSTHQSLRVGTSLSNLFPPSLLAPEPSIYPHGRRIMFHGPRRQTNSPSLPPPRRAEPKYRTADMDG